ncbi:DUF397 domain-containing protein [Nocardiopsis baichengensis]|uniref:DUF397 domain-containing protein n=1 Tax=Nocardiopsis baichengensis TaxID=280240 RepID=UPI000A011BCF|nr:DUF397 domain-containing protein [Nocardiopsis baichengensis]
MKNSENPWKKSTYSGGTNQCVEISRLRSTTSVRDSKRPRLLHLTFPQREWTSLLSALRRDTDLGA